MSILIKGMEMPKSCRECPFEMYYFNCGETRCRATLRTLATDFKPIPFDGRADDCPLIEIQPHGRLIDADALKWNYIRIRDDGIKEFSQYGIDRAPTVIEADYPPSVPLKQVWTELFGEGESDVRRPD